MQNKKTQNSLWLIIILTTLPMFYPFRELDLTLFSSDIEEFFVRFLVTLSNVSGLVGAVMLFWQFILGIRYIVDIFEKDYFKVIDIHTKLGKYGMLFVLFHPFLIAYSYVKEILWVFAPEELIFPPAAGFDTHVVFGRMAFYLFLAVWISSALLRAKMKFRPWLYIHYLSYPLMLLVFLHAREIGSNVEANSVTSSLWVAFMAIFFLLSLWRLLFFAGVSKSRFRVESIDKHGESERLILKPESRLSKNPEVGQYVYLQLKRFGEEHPFTVADYDKARGTLELGIKREGKFTSKVADLDPGQTVFIDGPYGSFTSDVDPDTTKVILAGGIGITPFIRYIKENEKQEILLLYCCRNEEDMLYADILREHLGSDMHEFITRPQKHKSEGGRISKEHIERVLGDRTRDDIDFMVCGSPRFVQGMNEILAELDIREDRVHVEEFSF